MIGSELAVHEITAALERAVRDRHRLRAAGREVRRDQLDHLAGADEQHLGVAQVFEQLRGEANGGRRHADRVGANFSGRANLFRDRERALEHLVQRAAQADGGRCLPPTSPSSQTSQPQMLTAGP